MRKIIIALVAFVALNGFIACNSYETYGDKKDKERAAIKKFIADSAITVISEDSFKAHNYKTDVSKNEFVYMNNSGVYMQIVRQGVGKPVQDGENPSLIFKFMELCLLDSTSILHNMNRPYDSDLDVMTVLRQGATYTAYFVNGLMASTYGESVPSGWLVPLSYINVGRPKDDVSKIAKVRLIVPHSQGHTVATSYVYPYYYEITFQRDRKSEIALQ